MFSQYICLVLLISSLAQIYAATIDDDFKVINIESGKIRGKLLPSFLDQRKFYSFRGIPYAKPPLGELRFKPPVKVEPWNNVRDALDYGNICIQHSLQNASVLGNEDCLTINVYTPGVSPAESLPVLLAIHGGAYLAGSSQWFGPELLLNENLILVTFNYRLGPLGFISLKNPEYSGNAGLKDQLLALNWVHDNIHQFGGDNSKITLFGQSAGANAANLHVLQPQSRKLFKRAILSSGSALVPWAFSPFKDHNEILEEFATLNEKKIASEAELIEYLKNIDANLLVEKTFRPFYLPGRFEKSMDLIWAPVIEDPLAPNAFITDKPEHILFDRGDKMDIDTLFGFNYAESYLFTAAEINHPELLQPFNRKFNIQLPLRDVAEYNFNSDIYRLYGSEIREHYFDETNVTENLSAYTTLMSDVFFLYGIDKAVKTQAKISSGKTYYYKFSVDLALNAFGKWTNASSLSLPGATHADELPYIFKMDQIEILPKSVYDNIVADSNEGKAIKRLTKIISNFVTNGNPNVDNDEHNLWRPVHGNIIHYANITNTGIEPEVSPHEENIGFWDAFFLKHQDTLKVDTGNLSVDEVFLITGHI